jgi:hypothetical protein
MSIAATDVTGHTDAELDVTRVSDQPAEPRDGGGRGARSLGEFGDGQFERGGGVLKKQFSDFHHDTRHLWQICPDAMGCTDTAFGGAGC